MWTCRKGGVPRRHFPSCAPSRDGDHPTLRSGMLAAGSIAGPGLVPAYNFRFHVPKTLGPPLLRMYVCDI